MNWLKAMLLMVVLGAILYGVNVVLNKSAPVESPASTAPWASADGSMGPPVVGHGMPGMSSPPGASPAPYSQTPAGSSVYGSGNFSATNSPANPPSTGTAYVAPSSVSPPGPTGYQGSVYQPATPPIVNADPAHASLPVTPVGLVTESPSAAPPPASPASPSTANPSAGPAFATAMDGVMTTLRAGKLAEGLQQLTRWCDDPQLNPEETKQRDDLLGRLAGTVVYSRQHLLLPPYVVLPGDRLQTIADGYKVPVGLLAKINGIGDPDHLTAGDKLKVMRGPFMAVVSLNKHEVTLVVQQCYAGRFKLTGMGKEAATLSGAFKVTSKTSNPTCWIGFGESFGFAGAADSSGADVPRGLMLSSRDAEDVFDILSVGSDIVVR